MSDTVPLADAFHYCPQCGVAHNQIGRNPFLCAGCGFTFYFSPIVGVVCLIETPQHEIVMLIRQRDPGKGLFGLPGGFVDAGESADDAARREVREELQLTVTRLTYQGSFPNRYRFRGIELPVADLIFHCEVESLATLKADPGEVAGVHICHPGPAELDRMAFPSNRQGLELFLKRRSGNSP
ncbi:MAG: NUDIX hydrolase [Planctomycetaceae bacterium]